MATRAQRMKCRQVCKAMCHPLSTGYHIEDSTDTEQPIKRQDGFIAAWVFLTMMLAFAATISLGHWLTSNWSKSVDIPVIQLVAGILQLSCCALFTPILCNTRIRQKVSKSSYQSNSNRPTSCRLWTKKILPIIGITIFLTGMIAVDILQIVAFSDCMDTYSSLPHFKYMFREAIVALFYHPVRILFTSTITMLCFMYVRGELCFYRVAHMRYMLSLVLVNIIWIWVDTQLQESLEENISEYGYSEHKQGLNCASQNKTTVPLTDTDFKCLCKKTETFGHVDKASKVLYSFVVEYCLLVAECIAHMLFSMVIKSSDNQEGRDDADGISPHGSSVEADIVEAETRALLTARTLSLHNESPFQYHAQNVVSMENSYAGPQSDSSHLSYGSQQNAIDTNQDPEENSLPSNRLTYLFIALVLGLVFVVLTALKSYSDVRNINEFNVAYFIFRISYHTVAVVITFKGFRACQGFISRHRGYMGFEMLTLFSSFGYFLYIFFLLQANIAWLRHTKYYKPDEQKDLPPRYTPANILYIIDLLIIAIQVYTQSLFMLHSSKIKCPKGESMAMQEKAYKFKQVILYLAICNLFVWAFESFIVTQNISGLFKFHSHYYGKTQWEFISHIAIPLMIFYRFNSCIYLIGVHLST